MSFDCTESSPEPGPRQSENAAFALCIQSALQAYSVSNRDYGGQFAGEHGKLPTFFAVKIGQNFAVSVGQTVSESSCVSGFISIFNLYVFEDSVSARCPHKQGEYVVIIWLVTIS